jgi:IS4 transposase
LYLKKHQSRHEERGWRAEWATSNNNESKQRNKLYPIRQIGYRDPETGRHYVFIMNHFDWSAQTIADIYKQRWQVELFFKWIKQNIKIKTSIGNSKNAVLTQVLAA